MNNIFFQVLYCNNAQAEISLLYLNNYEVDYKKYDISYIVIGYNEQNDRQCDEVWQAPCRTEFLKRLGEVVFTSDYNDDYPLYIVDVREISGV